MAGVSTGTHSSRQRRQQCNLQKNSCSSVHCKQQLVLRATVPIKHQHVYTLQSHCEYNEITLYIAYKKSKEHRRLDIGMIHTQEASRVFEAVEVRTAGFHSR
jgi:hypothetical protein